MSDKVEFLSDILSRPWSPKNGLKPVGLFIGKGTNALEVAVAQTSQGTARSVLVDIWKARKGRRAAPLLLVVLHPDSTSITGATGEVPPVYENMDAGQVERLCREALGQPDRHAALRLLSQALPSLETALPGLTNEGLLALHELEHGVPKRPDWADAKRKARAVLNKRDGDLLGALGFRVEHLDNLTSLLRSKDRRAALAVMLRENESAEAGSARFNSLSPISYALKKADDENLPWVILTQGNRLRLYSTAVDAGVGRRGRTETYVECQPSLLADGHLPYLYLIYSAEALAPKGSLEEILEGSQRFAGKLAERLRERIYNHVVPKLAQGIAAARGIDKPSPKDISLTYEMALTVLFRLLFIAYAEDRDLLPYRFNDAYRTRSLKQKAQELADFVAKDTPIAPGDAHWQETDLLWQAVAEGNTEWGVPAYDGGLFASEEDVSKTGAELAAITLPNERFEAALRHLLVIETPEGVPGPVDFRSLGVREFGTIYEGLLESELAVAETDLVLKEQKKKGKTELVYVPAQEGETPEDGQLLRRMIARHCIYGVDLNGLAVQLARLAVWIHTFVPGLPLSFLDHNLVHGDALVGVGTLDEVREKFEALSLPMFPVDAQSLLGRAAGPLRRLANINDASLQDIAAAREALEEAREAISSTEALCDLIAAQPISEDLKVTLFPFEKWVELADSADELEAVQIARRDLDSLHVLHFPVAFPEVFLRKRPGFDVILGNPPWEKPRVEEHAFWARHFPGLRSFTQRLYEAEKVRLWEERPDLVSLYEDELRENQQIRKVLVGGAFPGMGSGDPDLYKAFCWRFWHLTAADGGRIGVVLPRSALAAKGSEQFRQAMFDEAARVDVTMLLNRAGWVFDEAEHRYTIGLVSIAHGAPKEESIYLRGPYATEAKFFEGVVNEPAAFYSTDVLDWNDSASLPLLPTEESVDVFAQLRKAPRLDWNVTDQWRARPDRELDATNDKYLMDVDSEECPDGFWPVYKGESFDLWTPDTDIYYAWADPGPVRQRIQSKRLRARNNTRSAHSEFPPHHLRDTKTLPCFAPRIAFRDVTNRTNQRTVIACLVPPEVFIVHLAPYLLWPRGDEKDQTFLLGILSSIPLDWYARRFVETHVSYYVFNPFPIPRPDRDSVLWQRVVQLAGRLACPDERFSTWADAVGVECGSLAVDEKEDMIHELDAVVAHLYGLSEPQLVHIYETFHEGWNYQARLDGVLQHFHAWRGRE